MSNIVRHYWQELREVERALSTMRKFGIPEISDAYQQLYRARGAIIGKMGLRVPRVMTMLARLAGLSPGEIKVWHDGESGYFTEGRARPGASPVYHHVSDEIAMAVLKGELTKELEERLLAPDPYLGE